MMLFRFFCIILCCFHLTHGSFLVAQNVIDIEPCIKKIIKTIPGQMGIAALHLESGRHVDVNGDVRFPMASTYKLPIALYCLSLVDRGVLSLDSVQNILPEDIRKGEEKFFNVNAQSLAISNAEHLTIRQFLKLMLEFSNNTSTDKILKVVGGPKKVDKWVHECCHIDQMSIDRTTMRMRADFSGIKLHDDYCCTVKRYNALSGKVSKKKYATANKLFFNDIRDTTTPCAMVDVLARMYKGEFVSDASKKLILDGMSKCHWGRMPRFLPEATKSWRKTGRLDGLLAEIGIIELPQNKGHLVLALYSNKSTVREARRENAMAKITKILFDYFSV